MTIKVLTGTYAAGYLLKSPVTSLTVASSGYIAGDGIETSDTATFAYSVVNEGSIRSRSYGIYLRAGGSVNNSTFSSYIEGQYAAVAINGGLGSVVNAGAIVSSPGRKYAFAAVDLVDGGTVDNGSASNTKALITGPVGVLLQVGYGSVSNFGTITATAEYLDFDSAVYLEAGGRVINGAAGSDNALVEGYHAISIKGAAGFVTNFGTIEGESAEDYKGAVNLKDGGTVENYGVILVRNADGNLGSAVSLYSGGEVINGSVSDTSAILEGSVGVYATGPADVKNFATIIGGLTLRSGGYVANGAAADTVASIIGAVSIETAFARISNFGSIHNDVSLSAGGYVGNGSPADTSAKIDGGLVHVEIEDGAGTVVNFGAIGEGTPHEAGAGVELKMGGTVVNGNAQDEGALIYGQNGVIIYGGAGTVRNFGTISGGLASGFAIEVVSGGLLVNGSLSDTAATIHNPAGGAVDLTGGSCVNFATITAGPGGYAVKLTSGRLTNGTIGDTKAQIDGVKGVLLESGATITNFGTIAGSSGRALTAKSSSDEVIVEAGSAFVGAAVGGGGTLDLASGTGTLTGVANGAVHVSGSMPEAAFSDFGTLKISAAGDFTVVGNIRVVAGDQLIDAGTMVAGGAINNSGVIELTSGGSTLEIDANTTLTGGGNFFIGPAATDKVYGASTETVLVNNNEVIQGGGQLGAGSLALSNNVDGVIEGDVAATLIIDAGANTIANAGRILARGIGSVTIDSAIVNDGRLETVGGTMLVHGPVSGAGIAIVHGGKISFDGAFDERVIFQGAGVLALTQSQGYTGTIVGFSQTGATALDLRDIRFIGAGEARFSGTANSGILTVSDGQHTSRIRLLGDFTSTTFTSESDGAGGTIVTASSTMAPALHFIAAIASLGVSRGGSLASLGETWRQNATPLMAPRCVDA